MNDKMIRRLVAVMLLALLGLTLITPYQVLGQGEATPEVDVTQEVTPEVTPTDEVTPEVTPTEDVTPEVTPTDEVTPEPTVEITPTEPTVTPTEPTVTPTEPTVTPTEPTVTPTEPTVTPTEPTVTPTEPTVTPTEPTITPTEPTATPTPFGCQKNNPERLDCSSLKVTAVCDGTNAVFTITNTGKPGEGDMIAPTEYRVIVDGNVVETGQVLLHGGESMTVTYSGGGSVRLEADQQVGHPGSSHPNAVIDCGEPTATPTTETPTVEPTTATPTDTPTDEPTPTPTPNVDGDGQCNEDGSASLFIKNLGTIAYSIHFAIFNSSTDELLAGTLDLAVGDNILVFSLSTSETQLRLSINLGWLEIFLDPCEQPTPTPTVEPTTETPTVEPTTQTPTPSPTPLGCQKNNPERLDCSTLKVTVVCDGPVAVFTIKNDGKVGEGNMLAPTEYRLIKGGTVFGSGLILLDGQEAMQITYSGGGTIKLEADQQVGHPGSSQPNASIKCSN